MSESRSDAGRRERASKSLGRTFDPQELRRRNANALAVDVLYLFTVAFFTTLAVRGRWPAVIAALPLATLLYFAWRSSIAFLVAQVLTVGLALWATQAGVLPL